MKFPAAGISLRAPSTGAASGHRSAGRDDRDRRRADRGLALQALRAAARDALAAARRAPGARRAGRAPRPDVRAGLVAARDEARPARGRDRRRGHERGPAPLRAVAACVRPGHEVVLDAFVPPRTSRASTSRPSRRSRVAAAAREPATQRCPSCPRSRRSAAASRRLSRAHARARSRSATRAGASRSIPARRRRARGTAMERLGRAASTSSGRARASIPAHAPAHDRTLLYDAPPDARTSACASQLSDRTS